MTARLRELEELLRSACAIAERRGVDVAWERFLASAAKLGINGVTARTYRMLASDLDENAVHVSPVGDTKEHILSGVECWCNPRIERHPGYDTVVVHNSEDGRELVEKHGVN